jgi:hypothetical protein
MEFAISNVVAIEKIATEAFLVLVDHQRVLTAAARLALIIMDHPSDVVSSLDLKKGYEQTFSQKVGMLRRIAWVVERGRRRA